MEAATAGSPYSTGMGPAGLRSRAAPTPVGAIAAVGRRATREERPLATEARFGTELGPNIDPASTPNSMHMWGRS